MKKAALLVVVLLSVLFSAPVFSLTTHAIILVIDGARYTETLGDSTHAHVPKIAALAEQGTLLANFRTAAKGSIAEDWSGTNPGHARLTTGTYQNIKNDGTEYPSQPGVFQQYRKQNSGPQESGWVICSKDKLKILANSSAPDWKDQYQPAMNCGGNGDGSGGYRADHLTHEIVKAKLLADRPALMVINYMEPDDEGHKNDWNKYLAAISASDNYAHDLWNTIQSDSLLRDSTVLFIVNDHGRHTNDFTTHGDNCEGCCKIMGVILGPDIKKGHIDSTLWEQIDVVPTIAQLLGFAVPTATGQVMTSIIQETTAIKNNNVIRMVPVQNRYFLMFDEGTIKVLNQSHGNGVSNIMNVLGIRTGNVPSKSSR
ncbi:MAG: sulfatase-like hydrolase/transferase [Fibrobacteria bacterium]|nr:sulfatase-like hydrolase/transferase [Fibrobacteria bacterium]